MNSPSPDWLLLPENVTVAIFDFFSPGKLLSLRQVCTRWQRLAEASAQTREQLIMIQCGCNDNANCGCSLKLMLDITPHPNFFNLGFNPDGTAFFGGKNENSGIALDVKVSGIRCRSFDWKNAQLVARLFPQISHFTVSHYLISAGHLDQIRYLLSRWSTNLRTFEFHSNYTLENPNKRVTRSQAVATANVPAEAYLNSQLTHLFHQLKSLPELKHLTLNYLKGKINSTVGDFAFLPRLEELHLDRMSLEANFQAACQQYFALHVQSAPLPVLRRFTHNVKQLDSAAREFTLFLQYSPEALPLATASTWNQQFALQLPTDLPHFLLRFPSLSCLRIPVFPGNTLGRLSHSLSSHNVAVLVLEMLGTAAVEEDMVPMPSVQGLSIVLHSHDHGRIDQLLAQIPTAFPRLSSLFLLDRRSRCSNAPSGPPLTTADDEGFASYARKLFAANPKATHQQVQSFLTIARQINTSFPHLTRKFNFNDQYQH